MRTDQQGDRGISQGSRTKGDPSSKVKAGGTGKSAQGTQ